MKAGGGGLKGEEGTELKDEGEGIKSGWKDMGKEGWHNARIRGMEGGRIYK